MEVVKNETVETPVTETEAPKMITEEEANQRCKNVVDKCTEKLKQVYAQAQKMQELLNDRTLEYWFKVLEHQELFDNNFIQDTVQHLTDALSVPKTEEEDNKETTEEVKE